MDERQEGRHGDWLTMPCPFKGGPAYWVSFCAGGKLRAELYIDFEDASTVSTLYDFLLVRKDDIETAFGGALSWEELLSRRPCRIADYSNGDVVEVNEHDTYGGWFLDVLGLLHDALRSPGAE